VVLLVIEPALATFAVLPSTIGPVTAAVESAESETPVDRLEYPVEEPVQVTVVPLESAVQSAFAAVETSARMAALARILGRWERRLGSW
jgi:hypothetical protein